MNLRNDKRQNLQMKLDFPSAPRGEASQAGKEATESLPAAHGPESPASTNRLMEEVCERENLKEALRQVKGNRGSAGADGMTVSQLSGYLKQLLANHPGTTAERNLRAAAGEAGRNPQTGRRRDAETRHSFSVGSLHPTGGAAGSAEAVGQDLI